MKRTALRKMLTTIALVAAIALAINLSYGNPLVYPPISVQSPQNRIYSSNEIELTFTVPSFQFPENVYFTSFSYILDGYPEVAIDGNTSIIGLSWGSHRLVVYAETSGGIAWSSQPVYFDVFLSSVWFVMPILALAILVFLGLLLYIKRSQSKNI